MRKKEGITLVALVITIIVLLILAGVSLSMLFNPNGLIEKAKQASQKADIENTKEQITLKINDERVGENLEEPSFEKKLEILEQYGEFDRDKCILTTNKNNEIDLLETLYANVPFITRWKVNANDTIHLPIAYGYTDDNNFIVDWGDGTQTQRINEKKQILAERPSHVYEVAGEYDIKIYGICRYFTLSSLDENKKYEIEKLIKLVSWGSTELVRCDFGDAVNLEGVIPEPEIDTFSYIDNSKSSSGAYKSFSYLFSGCSKITQVPENLFISNPNATSFKEAFKRCTSLEQIPDKIFENNQNVIDFSSTFRGCEKVTKVPELWTRTTPDIISTGCFKDCGTKTQSIPDAWK